LIFFLGIQDLLWLQAVIAAKLSQPLIIAILQGTAWEAQPAISRSQLPRMKLFLNLDARC